MFVSLLVLTLMIQPLAIGDTGEVMLITDLTDLFEAIEGIEMEMVSDGERGVFEYTVTDTESIDGKECWVVDVGMGEVDNPDGFTIWVEKSSGETLQAKVDGDTLQGESAERLGSLTLNSFRSLVYGYWKSYDYVGLLEEAEAGNGEVTKLGSRVETVGETELETYGLRFDGKIGAEDLVVEIWYAPMPYGGILTMLSLNASEGDVMHEVDFELKSINLVDTQEVPSGFKDLVSGESGTGDDSGDTGTGSETDTGTGDETGTSDETDDDTGDDSYTSGGGIPGYPVSSLMLGVVLLVLLYTHKRHFTL